MQKYTLEWGVRCEHSVTVEGTSADVATLMSALEARGYDVCCSIAGTTFPAYVPQEPEKMIDIRAW